MASMRASGPAADDDDELVVLEAEERAGGSSRGAEPPSALTAVEEQQDYRALECRRFWKAGSYEVPSGPAQSCHGLQESSDFDRARVHPKFLHTNATSHKWAFGAIAELLDNAVDEVFSTLLTTIYNEKASESSMQSLLDLRPPAFLFRIACTPLSAPN